MNEHSDYFEIDLLRLAKALWRRAGAVLLAGLLGGGIAFSCAALLMQPRYESTVLMYVDNSSFSPDTPGFSFNQAELTAAQTLVNSYLVVLESRPMLDAVIEQAQVDYSHQELLSMIEGLPVDSTEFFEVTVTSTDPLEAQKIANTIAKVLPEQVAAIVNGSSIRVVYDAVAAEEPSSPNILLYTLGGFVCGLILACGVVVLSENQSDRIYDPTCLADAHNIPLLGRIPTASSFSFSERDKANNPAAKSYKMLRTQLLFTLPDGEQGKIIGITSAGAQEGKTSTAINLARSLAETGKKVLFLEADLRQPQISNALHLKRTPGLSERLAGQPNEIIQQSREQSNLYLIPAGEVPPNPSELLGSPQMQRLLQTLAEDFAWVLLDLPSVNHFPDALSLTKWVDGFLFVVRQESSTRRSVEEALRNFVITGATLLGFVVTDSRNDYEK